MKNRFLTYIFALCFSSGATAQCDPLADSLVLVTFYQHTNGNSWQENTNWLQPGQSIDTWFGVQVDGDGCVVELTLAINDLSGAIPPELGQLSELTILDLCFNLIGGIIPPELEQLNKLTILNLAINQLSGTIPPGLGNLTNLTELALHANLLDGTIPPELGNLINLTELGLTYNDLSGAIPPELENLINLKVLTLRHNQLSGTIPPGLGNLINLKEIRLGSNRLNGPIPEEFGELDSLTQLSLYSNDLSGPIPATLGQLTNLTRLELSDNQLNDSIPTELGGLTNLSILDLSLNALSGTIPATLGNLTNLTLLWLDHNQLIGAIPAELNNLVNLTKFRLNNNQLRGNIPDLSNLSNFIEFPNSSISNNNFTFENLSGISGLSNLDISPQKPFFKDTTFYAQKSSTLEIGLGIDGSLTDNEYTWSKKDSPWVPDPINDPNSNILLLPDIQLPDVGFYKANVTNPAFPELTLESHYITVQVCDAEADSTELVALYNASGGPGWIQQTNWLQPGISIDNWYGITTDAFGCVSKIDLGSNNLSGTIPALDMNTLDTLILAQNNLNGSIPADLNTPFITYVDLSHNELTGSIPDVVSEWMGLHVLILSNNNFSDIVPPDIGDLCELEELRLNDNMFDGELSDSLTKLHNLQIGRVDFSNNNIDSLKQKIAFFCPFGDTILLNNPSYDRFLSICNVQCSGDEWDNLGDFPWIADTLATLPCPDISCANSFAQAGFVDVRGIKTLFIRTACYTEIGPPPIFNEEILFYDCGGYLLEMAQCNQEGFCSEFGAISKEEFDSLAYDIRWSCGQDLSLMTSLSEPAEEDVFSHSGVIPLEVFPNPASAEVHFQYQADMELSGLRCTDLWGRAMAVNIDKSDNLITLDIHTHTTGMYVLTVPGKSRVYMAKVVVQR